MQRLRPPAGIAAGALALWLVLPSYVNYDTAWSLVWGRGLVRGTAPALAAPSAPTPHPLGTLLGVLLAPLGAGAGDAATLLVLASLAAVAWLASALARAWFGGAAAAWLAAALALTSVPLLTAAARSYLDVPCLALVLGALLVETRRPRAGAPVLGLLAVAGLWRPEAWVFSGAYWIWSARGRPGMQRMRLGVLAAAAPAVWLLGDQVLAGDPLHSFTWTREQAAALGRARGLGALREALPDKLAHAVGVPVLAAGTTGLALLVRRVVRAGGLAAAALGASLAGAAALTAAGMPLVERYLLLPLALLLVLAAGGAAAAARALVDEASWTGVPGQRRSRTVLGVGAVGAALLLGALGASVPGRLGAVASGRSDLAAQATLRADLRALAVHGGLPAGCARVASSNHKLIPLLALWTGRPATSFAGGPGHGEAYVAPATAAAQRTLRYASSDPPEVPPPPPAGAAEVARNRAWRVEARC